MISINYYLLRKSIKKEKLLKADKKNINNFKLLTKFKIGQLKKIIFLCFFVFYSSIILVIPSKTEITSDNNRLKNDFEDNIYFIKQNSTIKPIAFYNTKTYLINETLIVGSANNISININNFIKKLESQIKFAKNHGIYGFGFYFFSSSNKQVFNKPIDILIENKNLYIYFLLIWKNEEKEIYYNYSINQFFYDIKKYVTDKRYIKFDNKIVIGVDNNILEYDLNVLRQLFKENELGEIFILTNENNENKISISNKSTFDGIYYSTHYDSLDKIPLDFNKSFGYFYTHLIYYNLDLKLPKNRNIYRTSYAMKSYPIYLNNSKTYLYGDYSPEKFYFLNKIIIDWTLENQNKENQYIFLDNFQNLEPNELLGYTNINYFSKALYGLKIMNKNFNLKNLQNSTLILIQIHIYYIDLLAEVVNKTNNIPLSFDLYITTNDEEKKIYIENYLKSNTKANKYEVLITPNKGRDVVPFLIQLYDNFRNYKYFCHIHTKKHLNMVDLGNNWRSYLYENLLGSENIISQILSDFENHNDLGLIFPKHFSPIIQYVYKTRHSNTKHLNKLLRLLFPKRRLLINDALNFPSGNMFWARISAIYQIFNKKIIKFTPKEKGQIDGTILHGIERFWPFLIKLNGFCYKTILYYI